MNVFDALFAHSSCKIDSMPINSYQLLIEFLFALEPYYNWELNPHAPILNDLIMDNYNR
ncbi:hypothetical protein NMY3_00285 [Candidatus Nitrosocosmicus oleophilus]|uniref:Uncharacterized protein n=1 Tax=Candidatus Nitrosocosmicus oleophilus TaxID=1353260 RepID=A0A654LVV7_9ARCH|nr:hypothetical protein NMY3_00285 [Candidatus Nitrosocosmicus oleophilus]